MLMFVVDGRRSKLEGRDLSMFGSNGRKERVLTHNMIGRKARLHGSRFWEREEDDGL